MTKEETLRKPGWEPGPHYAAIVLGDGQEWHFPRPRLIMRAVIDPETKRLTFASELTGLSVPYGEILDKVSSSDPDSPALVVDVALQLLKQNYNIPDDLLGELFWFDLDTEASRGRWQALYNLCTGKNRAPKAEAPGSD